MSKLTHHQIRAYERTASMLEVKAEAVSQLRRVLDGAVEELALAVEDYNVLVRSADALARSIADDLSPEDPLRDEWTVALVPCEAPAVALDIELSAAEQFAALPTELPDDDMIAETLHREVMRTR